MFTSTSLGFLVQLPPSPPRQSPSLSLDVIDRSPCRWVHLSSKWAGCWCWAHAEHPTSLQGHLSNPLPVSPSPASWPHLDPNRDSQHCPFCALPLASRPGRNPGLMVAWICLAQSTRAKEDRAGTTWQGFPPCSQDEPSKWQAHPAVLILVNTGMTRRAAGTCIHSSALEMHHWGPHLSNQALLLLLPPATSQPQCPVLTSPPSSPIGPD
jgi:hypothetical protein